MVKKLRFHSFRPSLTGVWWRDDKKFYAALIPQTGRWVVRFAGSPVGVSFASLDSALFYADVCDAEV